MSIRVYVVEDHPLMRQTLVDFLGASPDIELCGLAADADEALAGLATGDPPSVVLLDLSLPGRSGLELLREINQSWQIPCLILSGHGEPGYARRALAAGACGYVLKGYPAEILAAIHDVVQGGVYLSEPVREALAQDGGGAGA